jgi:hypothetical protein
MLAGATLRVVATVKSPIESIYVVICNDAPSSIVRELIEPTLEFMNVPLELAGKITSSLEEGIWLPLQQEVEVQF